MLIAAANEGRARGRADGSVGVGIGQAHAFPRETIDVGCSNVRRTVASEVAVTQIVHHNDDDVRWALGLRLRTRAEKQRREDEDVTLHHPLLGADR